MSYIERSLGDGEQIVIRARFHWLYSLRAWLAVLVPLVVLVAVMIYADEMVREGAGLDRLTRVPSRGEQGGDLGVEVTARGTRHLLDERVHE